MIASVKNTYEYNLFGLPFFGCDLCGFNGDAQGDLCTRWHQLGTLFPFARNHNQNATTPQEPFRFNQTFRVDDDTTYTDLIRTAIQNRYTYIRYYYSAFWNINEFGGSFFMPLFFEFPTDPNSYNDIERNILLGTSLKASIEVTRLTDGTTDFYFPLGTWCQLLPVATKNFQDGCIVSDGTLPSSNVTFRTHMEDYYIHQRNGSIVPTQNATLHDTKNTPQQLSQLTDLFVLPNGANSPTSTGYSTDVPAAASGYIYFDDGVSAVDNFTRFDLFYAFDETTPDTLATLNFTVMTEKGYIGITKNEQIGNITIYNPFPDAEGSARQFTQVTVVLTDQSVVDITA
jgi:alpha-glucosidase (family GH31 glycosyl hydrolase)